MNRFEIPIILALLAAIPAPALAQAEPPVRTVITLHPRGEPTPALKYTLLPEPRELVPGNAAIFYHRAIERVLQTRYARAVQDRNAGQSEPGTPEDRISNWISGPIDHIPREEARTQLDLYRPVLREVELGALREDCDWEFDNRPETIDLVIEEIQNSRSLARLVSLQARLAILDGDLDGAVHWHQVGYALARHVSRGPVLIQGLVGISIANVMNDSLIELIRAEGTPCLYWAIARLPDPLIDMTPGLEGERQLIERMLPELRELDGPPWSVERARQFVDDLLAVISTYSGGSEDTSWATRLGLTAIFARVYPEAKRTLIEEGVSEDRVEAMPVAQVVGIVSFRRYRELSDDLHKWMSLPYWQAYRGIDAESVTTVEARLSDPGLALFSLVQPALLSVEMAQVRLDRQLAALRCVEAIRLHAASNEGRLPPSLEAIEEVPAPLDPATGEPFAFELIDGGEAASLSAPIVPGGIDLPAFRIDYLLRLSD